MKTITNLGFVFALEISVRLSTTVGQIVVVGVQRVGGDDNRWWCILIARIFRARVVEHPFGFASICSLPGEGFPSLLFLGGESSRDSF
jgi:hypothetical protein